MTESNMILSKPSVKEKPRLIGRLTTEYYSDNYGFFTRKRFRVLKRLSQIGIRDYFLCDDEHDINLITNLHEVPDGVYSLEVINAHRDWETGYIEEWDYCLVPYTEGKHNEK